MITILVLVSPHLLLGTAKFSDDLRKRLLASQALVKLVIVFSVHSVQLVRASTPTHTLLT